MMSDHLTQSLDDDDKVCDRFRPFVNAMDAKNVLLCDGSRSPN